MRRLLVLAVAVAHALRPPLRPLGRGVVGRRWSAAAEPEVDAEVEAAYQAALAARISAAAAVEAWDGVPPEALEALARGGNVTAPLPVQVASYGPVREGLDCVVQSPTATGKTLAYVLPILASLARAGPPATNRTRGPASPRVLVLAPSRELAAQIGRAWALPGPSPPRVAVVVGGAPLERSVAALRRKGGADVVVATSGRLAELLRMREPAVTLERCASVVLDEADRLLDEADAPEVRGFLDAIRVDYQLVLVSATITPAVRGYARGAMELVAGSDVDVAPAASPRVSHAALPCAEAEWVQTCGDLLVTSDAPLSLVFSRTIADAASLADALGARLPKARYDVLLYHGDQAPQLRKRVVAAAAAPGRRRVLVATDVASRGLDLPGVGLVVQLGVPRRAGREGTVDADLYAHRAGRAARGENESGGSVLVYDPLAGEYGLVKRLATGADKFDEGSTGIAGLLPPAAPPRPTAVAAAALADAVAAAAAAPPSVAALAAADAAVGALDADQARALLHGALAALSGLAAPPPPRSLLTGLATARTLEVAGAALAPGDVTAALKKLGSGKLGRVALDDGGGTARVDVPASRADAILAAAAEGGALPPGWTLDFA